MLTITDDLKITLDMQLLLLHICFFFNIKALYIYCVTYLAEVLCFVHIYIALDRYI